MEQTLDETSLAMISSIKDLASRLRQVTKAISLGHPTEWRATEITALEDLKEASERLEKRAEQIIRSSMKKTG